MKLGFGTLPGSGGPELRLPAKALLAGWILTSILMFLGCWLLTPWLLGFCPPRGWIRPQNQAQRCLEQRLRRS